VANGVHLSYFPQLQRSDIEVDLCNWLNKTCLSPLQTQLKITFSAIQVDKMANMDPDNNGAAHNAQAEPLTDIHIDVQFAKIVPQSNTPEYAKRYAREPWKHCRDAPNTFLSIRVNNRDEFMRQLKNLDPAKHRRVQHEIDRIEETRLRFEAYDDKRHMFDALRESQRAWRNEVAENIDDYLEENLEKAHYEHRERDLALLRRLKINWESSDKEERHSEDVPGRQPSDPEPDHGFKACAMYFRPTDDGTGWVGDSSNHTNYIGKFPNQKISVHQLLQHDEDNPLSKNEGSYLRYFHFPANNMSWIEVLYSWVLAPSKRLWLK